MKKLIKNNIKVIVAFILGAVIFGSVGVYATYSFASSEVTYTENNQTTVKSALDDLYTRANTWINPNEMENSKSITSNGTYDITNYKNATVNVANTNTETYSATTRNSKIDMGATNNYRYVNTNSVPNTNSATYTPTSNGTALDMGETNTYRYVNTSTVYDLGVNSISSKFTDIGLSTTNIKTNSAKSILATTSGLLFKRSNGRYYYLKANNWSVEKDHVQQVFSDVSCNVYSSDVQCNASDFRCVVYSVGRVYCNDHSDYSSCSVDSSGSVICE